MTQKTMLDLQALKNPGKQVSVYGDYTIHTNNNVIHNDEGPAIVSSISKEWFINGVRHRSDGPAIMYLNHPKPSDDYPHGRNIAEWYVDGKYTASYQLDDKTFNEHWNKK